MRSRKAQVSMFILAGILALIILSALIYTANEIQKMRAEKNIKDFLPKSDLKAYITRCVENTGSYALLKLGMQGGHIRLDGYYLNDSNLNVAYAYYDSYSLASIDQMSEELSGFMDDNLKSCVYKYMENKRRDYDVGFGNVTAKTIIAAEDVTFQVDFPVDVIEPNSTTRYDSFVATVHVRLRDIHRSIDGLLQKRMEDKFDVYHDCFYDPEMNLFVVDYGSSTMFIVEDKGSSFKNIESKAGPYRFLFAVKN